ncbi:MAG: WD40/YVTN/BNR-like repeat-containing protein, partial [Candidatus Kapaibacterium sp.]
MMRGFRLLLLAFYALFLSASHGIAQWTTVAPNLLETIPSASGGFGSIANKSGVVWIGRTAIWKSLDTGVTWTKVHDSFGGTITEIKFIDNTTGVVATTAGVFLTKDQGQTWTLILNHSAYGATFAGSGQNIACACDGSGFYYSKDQGATWNSQNPLTHLLSILGKSDGSAYGFGGSDATTFGALFMTKDLGVTWQGSSQTDYDSFSLAEDSCSGIIYRMNEEGHVKTNNAAQFYSTVDNGTTWVSKTSHPGTYYCASIAMSPHAIFCQTLNNGIDRSTDNGNTWVNINGPSNNIDTRLISAINDNVIVAADANGNILRTVNCGGL